MIKSIIDFGWLPQLVINFTDSMKLSESKELAVYIFAYCMVLALMSPLFSGFAVQNSASQQLRRREVLRNTALLLPAQDLTQNLGSRGRGNTDIFGIIFMFFKSHHCTHQKQCPVRQHTPQACLTAAVREKCPNTEFFPVCIFLYSN